MAKAYDTQELETLKAGVAAALSFEDIAAKLVGRSPYGLLRKASELGLLRKTEISDEAIRQKIKRATAPNRVHATADQRFENAMHKAIEAGKERVVVGVIKSPCTLAPRPMRGDPLVFIRSSAGLAADIGETVGSSPSDF